MHHLLSLILGISLAFFISSTQSEYNPVKIRVGNVNTDINIVSKKEHDGSQYMRYMVAPKVPLNIGFLGRGYNIIFGNILETAMGGDKGMRHPVFHMESSDEHMTPDWRFANPMHVDLQQRASCQTALSFKEVTTSAALQEAYENTMEESFEAGLGGSKGEDEEDVFRIEAKAKWGGSESYHNSEQAIESGEKSIILASAECSLYKASLNILLLPKFDPSFEVAIKALPEKYDAEAKRLYRLFIDTYGTHVISSVLMGARYGKEYILDKKELKDINEAGKTTTKDSGGSGGVTSEKVSLNVDVTLTDSVSKSRKYENTIADNAEDEVIFSIGAPYAEDPHEWAAQAGKDPQPIRIELTPLQLIVSEFVDKVKGRNLATAYAEYKPVGAFESTPKFGKCYQTEDTHLIYKPYVRKTSLIARCKPGDAVLGGSFVHLWNHNGDVHVDALRSTGKEIMADLQKYHKVRNAMEEAKYFLRYGSKMVKEFAKARSKDSKDQLFGKRVDPELTEKYLNGEINDLGLQKEDLVRKVHNAMKLFAGTPLEKIAEEILSENPYLKSIMEVSKGIAEEIKDEDKEEEEAKKQKEADVQRSLTNAVVLSTSGATLVFPESLKESEDQTLVLDTLIEVFDTLQGEHGSNTQREEAQSLYIDILKDLNSHVVDGIAKLVKDSPIVQKFVNNALKEWEKFSARFDDVFALFRTDMDTKRQHIKSTPLYQKLMQKAKEDPNEHANTVLATRNSLNWLFPRHGNSWVCGSGVLGMKPTGHSSMGYCSAFCCDTGDWKVRDVMTRVKKSNLETRTSEIYSPCPPGEVVVSGGILISDYHEGRFVQVVANKPEGEGWKCKIEWSEETYVPYIPRFRCYARCARTSLGSISCTDEKTSLINGHGTARCGTHQMAVSGGWDVQSNGLTYLKQTQFSDFHPVEGPKGFRCELGTSHAPITGDCIARCCDINTDAAVKAVTETQVNDIKPYWQRKHYADVGSYLSYDQELTPDRVLVSRNGQFFLRYLPFDNRMEVLEEMGDYRPPHVIGMHPFSAFGCFSHQNVFGSVFYKAEETKLRVGKNGLALTRVRDGEKCASWDMWRDTVNRMQLDDNGDVTFYDDDGTVFQSLRYSECRLVYKQKKLKQQYLKSGEMIFLGDGLVSKNKKYLALLNMNGKFGIVRQTQADYCHKPRVIWRADKDTSEDYIAFTEGDEVEGWVLRLQEDNNLVILDDNSNVQWSTNTKDKGIGKATLTISNQGELELRDAVGTLLWGNVAGAAVDCVSLRERLKIHSHRAGEGVTIKPGEGGLVSKNNEYILYVRLDDDGKDSHLELWRSAGDDCKPVRICTLKKSVKEVRLTNKGIYDGNEALFVFPHAENMNELVLSDSGTLTAYGGPNHRREFEAPVSMDCAGLGGVHHTTIPCTLEKGFFGGSSPQAPGAWQECPPASFLRGWKQTESFPTTFDKISEGICCGAEKPVECMNYEWPTDDKGLLHQCPQGYVLSGLFVDGPILSNIRRAKCCRYVPTGSNVQTDSYIEGKWNALDRPGVTQCDREGYYVAGFRKSPCQQPFCVEEFVCARP